MTHKDTELLNNLINKYGMRVVLETIAFLDEGLHDSIATMSHKSKGR